MALVRALAQGAETSVGAFIATLHIHRPRAEAEARAAARAPGVRRGPRRRDIGVTTRSVEAAVLGASSSTELRDRTSRVSRYVHGYDLNSIEATDL